MIAYKVECISLHSVLMSQKYLLIQLKINILLAIRIFRIPVAILNCFKPAVLVKQCGAESEPLDIIGKLQIPVHACTEFNILCYFVKK